jgi:hypothetical protein
MIEPREVDRPSSGDYGLGVASAAEALRDAVVRVESTPPTGELTLLPSRR